MIKAGDRLTLIDGSGFLFRAYHALPPLTRKSDGLPVGAVSGYCNMLFKLIAEASQNDAPTHIAVIFDAGSKTFRNGIYPAYKANRPETPEDLIPQFPLVREATRAFSVACVELLGYEADDILATYARMATEAGASVTIVSSDKDLMQLVRDGAVSLYDSMKNRIIGTAEVIDKFGVPPAKVIDVQALAGDAVDNVPGVPGIGIKTAAELINSYGDLENLLANAHQIKQPKRRENLIAHAQEARISYRLVRLEDQVQVPVPLDDLIARPLDKDKLLAFLSEMEFSGLAKRIAFGATAEALATPRQAFSTSATLAQTDQPAEVVNYDAYECVTDAAALQKWINAARAQGYVSVDTETTSLDPLQAGLCGVSLALAPNTACYIPCGHIRGEGLLLEAAPDQIAENDLIAMLKPLLEDDAVLKIGQNLKYDFQIFRQRGIRLTAIDDTMLMSYVLDAGLHGHGMDELSELHLGHKPIAFTDVAGKGKDKQTFDHVALSDATRYAAEDADITLRLWQILKPRLISEKKTTVYETMERPLLTVLADMEAEGVAIDVAQLHKLSNDFALEQASLEKDIYALAGGPFNVGSPKQLGEILFDRLKLPGGSRTKTGAWSTDADALETLAGAGHDLPQKVLDWRALAKLRGTYTDALPCHINPRTRRVHTSFAMSAAATGRLSSTDPNLQNIPVRNAAGRRIRQAFIAADGNKLISADYSQIELRLLAHIAGIDALKNAFANGIDIHAMTASEIFGIPVEGMPSDVRRRAKAINFGIVYGISAFGLAGQLGIGRVEADDYIKRYFARFPGIRDYMETTKTYAREHGYVETLFGRRIHIREIDAKNAAFRAGAERAAINAPIQGAAADIIKRAMIRMPDILRDAKLPARMLLQVHDELLFEVPEAEAERCCTIVASAMEKAALPAQDLSVRLIVEARAADNWDAAH